MQLRFVGSESAFDYFRATKDYLETHAKPVAFYSDKHGIFRVNAKDATGGDRVTQYGRVLSELNIDIICAHSPQAKACVSYYAPFVWLTVVGTRCGAPWPPGLALAII